LFKIENKQIEKEIKMKKHILTISMLTSILYFSGCGGNKNTQNTTIQAILPPQGNYIGAASAGDLATFYVNGTQLDYNVSGMVFGNQSGTLSLNNYFDNNFWYATTPATDIFLSNNLGIARVLLSPATYAYVIGLKQSSLTIGDISGKEFLYMHMPASGIPEGFTLKIDSNQTFTATNISTNTVSTGCWKLVFDHLIGKLGTSDCSLETDNTADYRIMIKPGSSRSGIIVDYTNNNGNGDGYGIGVEKRALTNTEVSGTYRGYYYDPTIPGMTGFSEVTVNGNSFTWSDCNTTTNTCTQTNNGTLALNKLCDNTDMNGTLCATDSGGNQSQVFIDPTDGYYFAVDITTGNRVEIGSNQQYQTVGLLYPAFMSKHNKASEDTAPLQAEKTMKASATLASLPIPQRSSA
jgi:hypothetical protein